MSEQKTAQKAEPGFNYRLPSKTCCQAWHR